MRAILRGWLATMLLMLVAGSALGANPYAPARIVNGQVISNYEVTEQIRLMRALGQGAVTRQEALDLLTDQRLMAQAAEQAGIKIGPKALETAIETFAKQRSMSKGGLLSRIKSGGVSRATLEQMVRTQVSWRDMLVQQFRDRAVPSQSDLDIALERLANRPVTQVFLREIALPFAEHGPQQTRVLAAEIRKAVAGGMSFSELAKRFSRAPSGPKGGALGWRPVERLAPELAAQFSTMRRGQLARNITIPAGIILLQMADRREVTSSTARDLALDYLRLALPNDMGAQAIAAFAAGLENCAAAKRLAAKQGLTVESFDKVATTNVPAHDSVLLAGLDDGEAAVGTMGATTTPVILLCKRTIGIDDATRVQINDALFNQRMGNLARNHLARLRADAVITAR